jgi:hypothetical protein
MDASLMDQGTYWSAVAQVIPVLALAVVLETRVLARQWAQPKSGFSTSTRLVWSSILSILWLLLLLSEGAALFALAFDVDSSLLVGLSLGATLLGLALVVGMPITSVIALVLGDWLFRITTRFYFSPRRRLIRELDSQMEGMVNQRRETRNQKISLLQSKLAYYMPTSGLIAPLEKLLIYGNGERLLSDESVALLHSELEKLGTRPLIELVEDSHTAVANIDAAIKLADFSGEMTDTLILITTKFRERAVGAVSPEELLQLRVETQTALGERTNAWT